MDQTTKGTAYNRFVVDEDQRLRLREIHSRVVEPDVSSAFIIQFEDLALQNKPGMHSHQIAGQICPEVDWMFINPVVKPEGSNDRSPIALEIR